ncbi:hypothetical protein OPQ81_009131 [Rhizoctonia solani]|nr:hypothetical protein OPQ81_009131 [Rhizoctonia solani]
MPPSQIRSRSGCSTCKARRKKCDETKPHCQRCQHSGIECSGYSYLGGTDHGKVIKNWTRPAYSMPAGLLPVHTKASRTTKYRRSSSDLANSASSAQEVEQTMHEAGPSLRSASYEFASQSETSSNLFSPPFELEPNRPSYTITSSVLEDWWNLDPTLFPPTQQIDDSSHILQQQPFQTSELSTPNVVIKSPAFQCDPISQSLTPGQASLFQALFSLSDHMDGPSRTTAVAPGSYTQAPDWSSPAISSDGGQIEPEDEDNEDESVKQIIYGTMRLDMNAEGNVLPYILESYAAWITRTAFEPKKAAPGARDLIFKQFDDSEDSRWTVRTLASVVRTLARSSTWGEGLDSVRSLSYQPAVRALRERVHQKVDEILSHFGPMGEQELSDALKTIGNVMEIASIYYTTASLVDALDFMRTASSLFRSLCPDPSDKLIDLQSLLSQPIISLRHYAIVDIISCVPIERSMLFHYATDYNPNRSRSAIHFPDKAGLQWLHGIPDVIVIAFARINIMRQQGYADPQVVADTEAMLRNFVVIPSVSSDPFLTVARIMVQECWRQSAYIYLYMGACNADADDMRVKKSLTKFIKLLKGTKPGHTPDAFLMMNCMIGGIAARSNSDREVIRNRMLNSERFKYPGAEGNVAVMLLEYIWLRSDGERRPAAWSDLHVATRKATRRPPGIH